MDQTQEEEYKRKISDLEDVVRQKSNKIAELENRLKETDIRSMSTSKDIRGHEMGVSQEINTRSEDGKDFEFEELLQLVNALDFLELFNDEKVGKNELMACDLNDLISLGIPLERAQQLNGDLTKETKRRNDETDRKKELLAALKHFNCEELYDDLIKIGYIDQGIYLEVGIGIGNISIDHDVLKKIGLSFAERKKVLTKIQDQNEKDKRKKEHEEIMRPSGFYGR